MGKAATKSGNLQRALEARRRANAEREARERAIVQSLKEFLDELDKLDHAEQCAARDEAAARARAQEQIGRIERELAARLERIRGRAAEKASAIGRAAGAAAQVMRTNGETVAGIAAQSGQTQSRVRELLRLADSEQDGAGARGGGHAEESARIAVGSAGAVASMGDGPQVSGDAAGADAAGTEALSA
ncbi:hypothetical protein [Mycolicibacterium sp. D5.8-2]|uniref:hypothetical protein n=1 Tax=Mycolicibacterium sp. D5.8-2 TaxID=3085903 RepID=UPI00298C162A|nr:hypothetical protein [Mycolicibacterium sp. D5.8-2]MDW5610441.1 hypothetical protein [Mycolicibacterium sp. D5.8-2]